MNLRDDLLEEDRDLADPIELEDNPTQSADPYRWLSSKLPKLGDNPPEAFPHETEKIEDLLAYNRGSLELLCELGLPRGGGAHVVCSKILEVEHMVMEEYAAECQDGVERPLGTYEMNKMLVAEGLFKVKPYKEGSSISMKEWEIEHKTQLGYLELFRSISSARGVFAEDPEMCIGPNFHDKAAVIVCILGFAVEANRIINRWSESGNEKAGHSIVIERYHKYREIIQSLRTTEREKSGFLYWLDNLCYRSHTELEPEGSKTLSPESVK